jgi:predicted glycoside hydrolase/deacetylase ChbG (UPF0249 family)
MNKTVSISEFTSLLKKKPLHLHHHHHHHLSARIRSFGLFRQRHVAIVATPQNTKCRDIKKIEPKMLQ